MSREKQTYNPCDDCQYSYSKNGQESRMCKICEYTYFRERKQSEWISVDERLPEENTEVLIYCKTNNDKEVFFVDKIRYFRGIAIWQVWSGKVTHWMPLPELPKMKGGE